METGKIERIEVPYMSGLAEIYFDNGKNIAIESGYGLRNLVEVLEGNPIGKQIHYIAHNNIMESFEVPGRESD